MNDEPLVIAFDASDEASVWAHWDAQKQRGQSDAAKDVTPLRFATYWRCSTEDNQDPETSRGWQYSVAQALVQMSAPPGSTIVAEYSDVGESRSIPWARRSGAGRLLADLKDPNRGWDALVVGEGKRCWYGSQFADVSPTITHYGVDIYIPELSGRYDPNNSNHYTMMTLSGGMSLGERQTTQVRVRAGMKAQVEVQGRYQGGRAPYGYRAVGHAPHPNPSKAADGRMLKRLEKDPVTAPVVARIFAEAMDRKSLREIVTGLNRDGILCPSAYDPARNTHRLKDGWQVSTVRAILENERYTGYEQWGKAKKHEELVSPEQPALGKRTRFVKNPDGPVRSAQRAHDPIVNVQTFLAVQNEMKRRSTNADTTKGPRASVKVTAPYPLRGLIYCGSCGRKMSPDWYRKANDLADRPVHVRYRCRRRELVEGSDKWEGHPTTVTVQQDVLLENLQEWLSTLFQPEHRDTTVDALVGALGDAPTSLSDVRREQDAQRLTEAEKKLENQLRALERGDIDLDLLAPRIKDARDEVTALKATLASHPPTQTPTVADVRTLLDEVAEHFDEVFADEADFKVLNEFLTDVGLRIVVDAQSAVAVASLGLRGEATNPHGGEAVGVSGGVRGGTWSLTPITSTWAI